MKTTVMNFKHIFCGAALLSLSLASCSDQMDYKEYRVDDEDFIKREFANVNNILRHIYKDLDYDYGQMYGGASLCSATDEAVYSHQGNQIESYYNGAWGPSNANSSIWGTAWDAINYCNLYLADFNNLTFDNHKLDKDYQDQMKKYNNNQWEVRFMRAYQYFLLVRQYGSVPLITTHTNADDANNAPQVPTDTIFKFIDDECVAIQDTIIADYSGAYGSLESEDGRVNRRGVLALRARAALYHASPLFSQGKSDAEKKELWRKAAQYALDCINDCEKKHGMGIAKDYAGLFHADSWKTADAQKEIIFTRRNAASNDFEKSNFPISMVNANGGNCPTQNLVDAYETTNGLAIDDPNNTMYNPQKPYENRDSRLLQTVAVNGEKWPNYLDNDDLQTWYGGADSRSVTYGTPTGYYLKKYVDREAKISGSPTSSKFHSWIIFRLGSVYLDYAEAMLNLTGSGYATEGELTMSAADAINKIRARAGQPDLTAGLSFEDFTKKYENERFIELAFEGHRIYDVRRWMKGPQYFVNIKVMDIEKNLETGELTFQPVMNPGWITKRSWAGDHQYLWPIPQSDILKAGNLTQNPGW